MSWLLVVLAAAGAIFILLRARRQAGERFDEVLKAQAQGDNKRERTSKGEGVDRKA